jgi:TonB family protein
MLTRALLICNDAKAIEAVTQVLSELEISFENIPDPSVAAKQFASQRFDPILVDCDNVADATLVLESARKSSTNQSSMTIAIVDGKAGVPTAFRLGARLVMTKPVSLEGARSTLRNALAMQRREAPDGKASAAVAAQGSSATITSIQDASQGQTTVGDVQAASIARPSIPPIPPEANSATARPSTAVKIDSVPAMSPAPAKTPRSAKDPAHVAPLSPSKTERDSTEAEDVTVIGKDERPSTRRSVAAPSFSTLEEPRRKISPYLLTGIFMILIAAGSYAAFTMLPAFHDMVLSEYETLHTLIAGTPARSTVPLQAQPVTATAAPASARPSNAAAETAGPSSATTSPASNTVADGFAPAAQATPVVGFKGDATKTGAASAVLLPTSATRKASTDSGPVVVAEDIADAHVSYRVRPVYPYVARRKGVEGAVVLLASVNADGSVDSVRVVSGNMQLAPSAVEAVKQWRYEPYYANGQPVVFQTQVTVQFQTSSH